MVATLDQSQLSLSLSHRPAARTAGRPSVSMIVPTRSCAGAIRDALPHAVRGIRANPRAAMHTTAAWDYRRMVSLVWHLSVVRAPQTPTITSDTAMVP